MVDEATKHCKAGHLEKARATFEATLERCPAVSSKAVFWVARARAEEDAGNAPEAMELLVAGARVVRAAGPPGPGGQQGSATASGGGWEHRCMTRAIAAMAQRLREAPRGIPSEQRRVFARSRAELLGEEEEGEAVEAVSSSSAAAEAEAVKAEEEDDDGSDSDAAGSEDEIEAAELPPAEPRDDVGIARRLRLDADESDAESLPASPGLPSDLRRSTASAGRGETARETDAGAAALRPAASPVGSVLSSPPSGGFAAGAVTVPSPSAALIGDCGESVGPTPGDDGSPLPASPADLASALTPAGSRAVSRSAALVGYGASDGGGDFDDFDDLGSGAANADDDDDVDAPAGGEGEDGGSAGSTGVPPAPEAEAEAVPGGAVRVRTRRTYAPGSAGRAGPLGSVLVVQELSAPPSLARALGSDVFVSPVRRSIRAAVGRKEAAAAAARGAAGDGGGLGAVAEEEEEEEEEAADDDASSSSAASTMRRAAMDKIVRGGAGREAKAAAPSSSSSRAGSAGDADDDVDVELVEEEGPSERWLVSPGTLRRLGIDVAMVRPGSGFAYVPNEAVTSLGVGVVGGRMGAAPSPGGGIATPGAGRRRSRVADAAGSRRPPATAAPAGRRLAARPAGRASPLGRPPTSPVASAAAAASSSFAGGIPSYARAVEAAAARRRAAPATTGRVGLYGARAARQSPDVEAEHERSAGPTDLGAVSPVALFAPSSAAARARARSAADVDDEDGDGEAENRDPAAMGAGRPRPGKSGVVAVTARPATGAVRL